jgi:ribosomal protein S13
MTTYFVNMLDSGIKIRNMVKDNVLILMDLSIKETINLKSLMAMECFNGLLMLKE